MHACWEQLQYYNKLGEDGGKLSREKNIIWFDRGNIIISSNLQEGRLQQWGAH